MLVKHQHIHTYNSTIQIKHSIHIEREKFDFNKVSICFSEAVKRGRIFVKRKKPELAKFDSDRHGKTLA